MTQLKLAFKYQASVMLTRCRQVTHKDVIGIPCIVDWSWFSTFSYTTSCTCVCQLVWLTDHFKVIDSL